MITAKVPPPPTIKLEPKITVEPQVALSPNINVAPAKPEVYVQTMPAPVVQVQQTKPCPWHFKIIKDSEGNMTDVIATPQ